MSCRVGSVPQRDLNLRAGGAISEYSTRPIQKRKEQTELSSKWMMLSALLVFFAKMVMATEELVWNQSTFDLSALD